MADLTTSANVDALLACADNAAMRTALGLVIGTNVQAYDADLTTWAGITPSANVQTLLGAADFAAFKTSLSLNNVENTALTTWTGNTSQTSVGTIGTGTWQGTAIAGAYGGTGVANTGKTITLGGNFTHSGAHTLTLTTTGNTSLTLPTSGTVMVDGGSYSSLTVTTLNATDVLFLDDVDQSHGLQLVVASNLTANRTLTLTTGDANRALTLTGDLAMSGANNLTLTTTGATNVTLPTTGTLATLAGVETLTNKSLPITVKVTSGNYTVGTTSALELYGGIIYVTGAATITIPAVTAGQSFTVITIGAVAVSVDPNASDLIMLDGTALSDGDKITNLSTSGDIAVFTYYDATGWYAATNGWTDTN